MRFVAVSDTHGCHRELKLPGGDVFLHAGDVCDRGNRKQAADFFDWIDGIPFDTKIIIWGNHDFDFATGNGTIVQQQTTFINASLYNSRKRRLIHDACVFDLG